MTCVGRAPIWISGVLAIVSDEMLLFLCQGTHSCSRVPTPPAPQTFLRIAIPAFTHSCVVLSDKQEKPKRK